MKLPLILFALFTALTPALGRTGEGPSIKKIKNNTVGDWTILHGGRNDLRGVYVQQFPDNLHSAQEYEGRHPALVVYVFKSMKAHQVEYNPDGTVKNAFWWNVDTGNKLLTKLQSLEELSRIKAASNCGKVPPGARFDNDCRLTTVPPPAHR